MDVRKLERLRKANRSWRPIIDDEYVVDTMGLVQTADCGRIEGLRAFLIAGNHCVDANVVVAVIPIF
jgi:hypothetical protein